MPSATTRGYPFPVGTDRVMDGDDSIKALAEAVDSDACFTKAAATGQAVTASVITPVNWDAATENTCGLTKTSASVWTITKAGLYVVTSQVSGSSQSSRGNIEVYAGASNVRVSTTGENRGGATVVARLIVGDIIRVDVFWATAASVGFGYLNVARLAR